MATLRRLVAVDLVRVYAEETGTSLVTTLAWGDEVEVETVNSKFAKVRVPRFEELPDGTIEPSFAPGFIRPTKSSGLSPADCLAEKKDASVLIIDFVDVQQGDAAVIETPGGKIVLVDGGDNQLYARCLASRYRGSSAGSPKEIDLLLVTHGDADHFAGSSRKETELLGPTRTVAGRLLVTGLETDLLAVADAEFSFLAGAGVALEVLGPTPVLSGATTGLPFLGSPPKGPRVGHESLSLDTKGFGG